MQTPLHADLGNTFTRVMVRVGLGLGLGKSSLRGQEPARSTLARPLAPCATVSAQGLPPECQEGKRVTSLPPGHPGPDVSNEKPVLARSFGAVKDSALTSVDENGLSGDYQLRNTLWSFQSVQKNSSVGRGCSPGRPEPCISSHTLCSDLLLAARQPCPR